MKQKKTKFEFTNFLAHVISALTTPWVIVAVFLTLFVYTQVPLFSLELSMFVLLQLSVFLPIYVANYITEPKNIFRLNAIPQKKREFIFISLLIGSLLNVALFAQDIAYRYFVVFAMVLAIFWGLLYILNKVLDKVSVHTSVFTFAIVAIGGTIPVFFLSSLLLPAVCWSRITLHRHSWFQLLLGIVVGAFCGILFWGV